jgi:hypothetical protein
MVRGAVHCATGVEFKKGGLKPQPRSSKPRSVLQFATSMLAHVVKTQKPTEIRATLLLFRSSVFFMDFVHAW